MLANLETYFMFIETRFICDYGSLNKYIYDVYVLRVCVRVCDCTKKIYNKYFDLHEPFVFWSIFDM